MRNWFIFSAVLAGVCAIFALGHWFNADPTDELYDRYAILTILFTAATLIAVIGAYEMTRPPKQE